MNAAVYVVIFGFILQVGRAGIENTIAFIVCGVFMFRFFERSVMAGAHSINKNLNLVRSVSSPCAVLPIAGVLSELAVPSGCRRGHGRHFVRLGLPALRRQGHHRLVLAADDPRDRLALDLLHRLRLPHGALGRDHAGPRRPSSRT